jgi:hypothetical protein
MTAYFIWHSLYRKQNTCICFVYIVVTEVDAVGVTVEEHTGRWLMSILYIILYTVLNKMNVVELWL